VIGKLVFRFFIKACEKPLNIEFLTKLENIYQIEMYLIDSFINYNIRHNFSLFKKIKTERLIIKFKRLFNGLNVLYITIELNLFLKPTYSAKID
jgi:hypothetical protein